MPERDFEALRLAYEAFGRRDWDAVVRGAHPDFELKTPGHGLFTTYVGPEKASAAFEDFFEPYEDVLVEPEEFFEKGDRIVVFFRQRCRPRDSEGVVEVKAAHVWMMREGRPAGLEIFPRREEALAVAGIASP
jgi:ketosteroid isomerase-like protein